MCVDRKKFDFLIHVNFNEILIWSLIIKVL